MTSTVPADAVVSVSWQEVSGTTVTTEQGSGVLVAPDEVLTAAHVVYDAAGRAVANAVVSSAAGGSALHAVGVEAAVHAMPFADWTQVASAAGDFALIHLAAPVTGLPTMALGSGFTGGAVTVTGFPLATAGAQDSVAETLSPLVGETGILQGAPLGAPGDPHGASGGPAWQAVGDVATVVGLTSSASGSTGFFVGLTAADVAQVGAWMAADHATPTTQPATTASAYDAIGALPGLAAAAVASRPAIDAALRRVVTVLTRDARALGAEAGFDEVAAAALSATCHGSGHHTLAAALLEGVVWGHDGGSVGGAVAGVAGTDPGILTQAAAGRAVHAGAIIGRRLAAAGY